MPGPVSPADSRVASGRTAPAARPVLKSPLRTATMSPILPPSLADGTGEPSDSAPEAVPPTEVTAQQVRQMQVSAFAALLRTQTNHIPFQEQTIHHYSESPLVRDR